MVQFFHFQGGSTPKAAVVKKGSKEFTRKNSKDK